MTASGAGNEVFLGVDVGSQGARVVAVDAAGTLHARRQQTCAFPDQIAAQREQSPALWWRAVETLLGQVAADLRASPARLRPVALAVTSTSGTVIPLAANHAPLHPALMFGDDRAQIEVAACTTAAARAGSTIQFGTSFGLPKMLWFARRFPERAAAIALWSHAADYVTGQLCEVWGVTDPTNALKSGYDPAFHAWPGFIFDELGLPRQWLPRVVPSGTVLRPLAPAVAERTGLPRSLLVTTGMTDGCTSQIAAGAVHPGDWNTTIGTTLVIKGVAKKRVDDPLGRLYSHRHPDGWWMPGGASNTGAEWISQDFPPDELPALEAAARELVPTPFLVYPLRRRGERFPFVSPGARGFAPAGLSAAEGYAAGMEGVAFIERLAYDVIENLTGEAVRQVFTAGGASLSQTWLEIRAAVLNRPIGRTRHPEGAVGAAIVAASRTRFQNLTEAARSMTRIELTVEPGPAAAYETRYQRFLAELVARGYLGADGMG